MNFETLKERRELLLMDIERDRAEISKAFQDLRETVSVNGRIREYPKAWVLGALVAGVLLSEFTNKR